MCYFLYGALQGDVSEKEYQDIQNQYEYKIARGTKHDIKLAVKSDHGQDDFRITDWICDCESPVGKHEPNDPVILELSSLISDLAELPGANQINICKTWTGKTNKKEVNLKLKDLELPLFLADMDENCLYSIDL